VSARHALRRPGVGAAWVVFGGVALAVTGWFLINLYHPAEWLLGVGKVVYGFRRWRGDGGQMPSQRWPPLGRRKMGGR
jgi:hypothetical protein